MGQLSLFSPQPAETSAGGAAPLDSRPAGPNGSGSARQAPAALALCVLGSGSGGNSSVLNMPALAGRSGPAAKHAVLIDAGFGPWTIRRRLKQAGIEIDRVAAICLTHLDRDHWRPNWTNTLLEHGIRVFIHQWHMPGFEKLPEAEALLDGGLVEPFSESFEPLPGLSVSPIPLPHDQKGTVGYHIEAASSPATAEWEGRGAVARVGYATDLGAVPPELIERFSAHGGVDLLAIESNYDPHLQAGSARPAFLKRRIMGELGHLSNEQAFEAVGRIAERCDPGTPRHIVLLHRSAQCNTPAIIRGVFGRDPSIGPRVTLTEQRRRSAWFHLWARPAVAAHQPSLFAARRG